MVMNRRLSLFDIIVSIVLSLLMILNIMDLIIVILEPGSYPFGSEFISPASIYRSEMTYVLYGTASAIIYLLAISFALRSNLKWLIVFLILSAFAFLYPIITAPY